MDDEKYSDDGKCNNEERKRSIPELCIETSLLYSRLKGVPNGSIINYPELTELIGMNVQTNKGYARLSSARRKLLNEDRVVFEAIHNVGLKRLDDDDIVDASEFSLRRVRRASRLGMKKLGCIRDINALSPSSKVKLHTKLSVLGVMMNITLNKNVARLENKIKEVNNKLPLTKTLQFFSEN